MLYKPPVTKVEVMVTYSLCLYKPFRVVTTGAQHDAKKVEKDESK